MRMTVEKMGEINRWYAEHKTSDIECKQYFDVFLEPDEPIDRPTFVNVIVDGHYICELDSLNDLIEHLELLKQNVVDWTGVYVWED